MTPFQLRQDGYSRPPPPTSSAAAAVSSSSSSLPRRREHTSPSLRYRTCSWHLSGRRPNQPRRFPCFAVHPPPPLPSPPLTVWSPSFLITHTSLRGKQTTQPTGRDSVRDVAVSLLPFPLLVVLARGLCLFHAIEGAYGLAQHRSPVSLSSLVVGKPPLPFFSYSRDFPWFLRVLSPPRDHAARWVARGY